MQDRGSVDANHNVFQHHFDLYFASDFIIFWLSMRYKLSKISTYLERERHSFQIFRPCKNICKYKWLNLTYHSQRDTIGDYSEQKKCLTGRLNPVRHFVMASATDFISILWKCNHIGSHPFSHRFSRQLSSPSSWQQHSLSVQVRSSVRQHPSLSYRQWYTQCVFLCAF